MRRNADSAKEVWVSQEIHSTVSCFPNLLRGRISDITSAQVVRNVMAAISTFVVIATPRELAATIDLTA